MPGGTKPLVYVSYAWSSRATEGAATDTGEDQDREAIVDELCEVLAREEQITVGRDKKLVRTGDSIVDFAADIASSGLILAVISHRSLRSDWCMVHELLQAFRRRNFDPDAFGADVLALVLEDALEDFKDKNALVAYWSARYAAEDKTMKLADPGREGSPKSWEDVDALQELCKRLPDLIRALGIRCMPRKADAIRENDFRDTRNLVLRRLEERGHLERGLADRLSPSVLSPAAGAGVAEGEPDQPGLHFLAIRLKRAHGDSGDGSEPLYSWRIDRKEPDKPHYEPFDLPATVGSHVRRSLEPSVPAASGGAMVQSSVVDLLQAVVDWLLRQPFGSSCLLELFVPVEWLDVDWSKLPLLDRRKRNSPEVDLHKLVPFVLRSWDRLEDDYYRSAREQLSAKFACLARGQGVWLAGDEACSPHQVRASERIATRVVGIKRLAPLDSDPQKRLDWLENLLISAAPLALWQLQDRPDWSDKARRAAIEKHLKRYGETLKAPKTGHPVHPSCTRLEALPLRRQTFADDPLVHDIAFLLDHPERAPAVSADQPDLYTE